MFNLRRLYLRDFRSEASEPVGFNTPWKVYGYCTEADNQTCQLLVLLKTMNTNDAKHVISGMAKLMGKACLGTPLKDVYDEKQCHEAFNYVRPNGSIHTIYRIWPGGKVRIYFTYGLSGKSILIFFGQSKNTNKISKSDKNNLATICENFLNCISLNQLNIMEQ